MHKLLGKQDAVRLRTDNEYRSQQLKDYAAESPNVLEHEFITPERSWQNGMSERFWATLWPGVRSVMSDSNSPAMFWEFGGRYINFNYNNVAQHSQTKKVPASFLVGWKPPRLTELHRFGSVSYTHLRAHET